MVVAVIALVLSMGGVSYGLATGSIDSREIRNNTIRTQDIRQGHVRHFDIGGNAVSGRQVSDNSLTGADIAESMLGKVRLADDASRLGGDAAASYRDRCPSGTQLLTGSCIETADRPAEDFSAASETCGAAQRRLPTTSELRSARTTLALDGAEVTSNVFRDGMTFYYMAINDDGAMSAPTIGTDNAFRCVAPPKNTG